MPSECQLARTNLEKVQGLKLLIDNRLEALFQDQAIPQKEVIEAARYSLLGPGKRLRPLFVLSALKDLGIPLEAGLDPAIAIEMIHTYTLIHDDLPCMDNDDLRRGRPTLHKVYSESTALLAGDYLLTYAFEILAKSKQLTPEQRLKLIAILSSRSGLKGAIGGQIVDMKSEGQDISWEMVQFMHLHKTAALFTAALEFVSIIANFPPKEHYVLQTVGRNFGVAFQIINDLYDDFCPDSPPLSDITSQKATALSTLGHANAKKKAQKLLEESINGLTSLKPPFKSLNYLIVNILKTHFF